MSANREILPKAWCRLALALAFALARSPIAAQVAEPPSLSPEGCIGIDSDAERLACYDRAFGRNLRPGDLDAPAGEVVGPPAPTELAERPSAIADPAVAASLLDSRWELSRKAKLGTFGLRAYKPIYLLPVVHSDAPNLFPSSPSPDHTVDVAENQEAIEAKFQLSFKTKIWQGVVGRRGDLWFGYTQSSRWQVYNADASRPFRETNYEPEAMLVFHTRYRLLGFDGRLLGVSLDHLSNGKGNPYSRSWNRIIGMVGLERGPWTVVARPWWRVPEAAKDDDNPDIADYYGRGDLLVVRRARGHEMSLLLRHSLRGGERSHGAAELGWVFPIHRDLKGYLQVFHGYGESLIDYNARSTRVGLGVSLLEWY